MKKPYTRKVKTVTKAKVNQVKKHLADGCSLIRAASKAGVSETTAWHIKEGHYDNHDRLPGKNAEAKYIRTL